MISRFWDSVSSINDLLQCRCSSSEYFDTSFYVILDKIYLFRNAKPV